MFVDIENEYKQASSAVEHMKKNAKFFHPDDEQRYFHIEAGRLRQTARLRKEKLAKMSGSMPYDQQGNPSYREGTIDQDKLVSEILVRLYKIFRYKADFDWILDDSIIYDEEGNESPNVVKEE